MGTFDVVEAIAALPILNYVGVEDFYDKLSFMATCILLIACSLIVTLREYVMDPISCYLSHNPGGENILKFMENYCWVQGTMSINDNIIPQTDEDWKTFEKTRIVYYQWVPFMLLFQAALFHTPRILWSMFTFNMTGDNIQEIIQSARKSDTASLALRIEYMLFEHREYRGGIVHRIISKIYDFLPLCVISKRLSNWLAFGYLFTKMLYLVNSVGQIYLMQTFLHLNTNKEYSSNFGMEIAKNIINGRNWEVTGMFPRVTYCVARVKSIAAVNTVTAQCVLSANLFIEKIYIFLWFWIVIVSLFTAISLIIWLLRFLIPSYYCYEIKKHIKLQGEKVPADECIEKFCKEFLRLDGIFLLHMIKINAGDLTTTPLINRIFCDYVDKYQGKTFTKYDDFSSLRSCKDSDKLLLRGMEVSTSQTHL